MTYDELYKKVEAEWHDSFKSTSWTIIWDIVKLHQEYDFEWGNETFLHCKCGEEYPCATIKLIEGKLQ